MGNLQDYGFPFNSVASDRIYNASDWRDYFQALVEGGIVGDLGDELEVTQQASPDKSVLVGTGFVVINGAIREVSADITVNISDNTSGSTRVDRIVARLDYTDRLIEIDVIEGTPGAGAPAVTQDSSIHEISLAQVELANGYSTITDVVITDERTYLTWRQLANHILDLDNPHEVTKTQLGLGSVANYGIASSYVAEQGTSNTYYMTPLRVKEAIDKNAPISGSYTGNGDTSRTISLGFTPSAVLVVCEDGSTRYYNDNHYGGLAVTGGKVISTLGGVDYDVLAITSGGFNVFNDPDHDVLTNVSALSYNYIAMK